jgi:hypothetical protein
MRLWLFGLASTAGALYAVGAFYFYQEEQGSRAPDTLDLVTGREARHPETTMGVVRHAFESNNFSETVSPLIEEGLWDAPSFFSLPFLMATYHAMRVEEPAKIRRCFERH